MGNKINFQEKFTECVGTSTPLVVVRTAEPEDAEEVISNVCKEFEWGLWLWDSKKGLQSDTGKVIVKQAQPQPAPQAVPAGVKLPQHLQPAQGAQPGQQKKGRPHQELVAAIDTLSEIPNAEKPAPGETEARRNPIVLIVRNLHFYWKFDGKGDPNDVNLVVTTLQSVVASFRTEIKMVIGISPKGELPPQELAEIFEILEHSIPNKDEFKPVVDGVEPPAELGVKLTDKDKELIAEASCGLTRLQAEKAYATAALRLAAEVEAGTEDIKLGPFYAGVVEEEKNNILNADGMLKRWDGPETFDSVGGNGAAKAYLVQLMDPDVRRRAQGRSPRLNAVTFIGPSGTGKTLMAKALGRYTGRRTYGANLSANKSKWVGESESNVRKMFDRASAMANIILYFDEFNEQVEGGEGDGHAVDKALRQTLMEWLDTHHKTDDVFVVLTANAISKQHMGLYRRLGKIFYVGHPGKEQKAEIWKICVARHGLVDEQYEELPDDTGWVGEDIDACCAFASALQITVLDAARHHVIPSSNYASDSVNRLRDESDGVCFDAETGEVFRKNKVIAPEATGQLIKRKVLVPKKKPGK